MADVSFSYASETQGAGGPFFVGRLAEQALRMRRAPAAAEEQLWQALRRGGSSGLQFRRQHPIGRFIVDSYCVRVGLVVEVDGAVHASLDAQMTDAERDAYLESMGLRVLRFTNDEVINELSLVIDRIKDEAAKGGQT